MAHYPPRTDLEAKPEFWADLLNTELSRDAICRKWGASAGYVTDRRQRLRDATGVTLPETSEISTNEDGTKTFQFIRHRPITLDDAREWIASTGDDPDHYNIAIKAIAYGGDKSSNKMSAWPKSGMALVKSLKLPELYAEAEKRHAAPKRVAPRSDRGTVIVLADWQIGKTGRRGGTPELLDRLKAARDKIADELERRRPSRILILDGGDGIEGFESGGDPQFTNDLSLPGQIGCYSTELFKFIRLAGGFAPLEIAAVPSNHAAWRRGKQNLGKPSDDWGLHVHAEVAKLVEAKGIEAEWSFPDAYDESICVDFMGTPIGLVHGNQFPPGKAVDWWTQQAMGDQAVARADVLVTAHYHSWGSGVAGQNPTTKRERYWVGAPTLDNGSDWYRNVRGRDSMPGTMIFDVDTRSGFDLASLAIV